MAKGMWKLAAGAALMLGTAEAAMAQDAPGKEPLRFQRAELTARVAKTSDGLAAATLPTGPNAVAIQVRREKSGEVEVHDTMEDIFVVQAGHATVIVGKPSGMRSTGPGEWRGGTIEETARYELAAGDVLWIPAGLAHQTILPAGGTFDYLAMKFPASPAP